MPPLWVDGHHVHSGAVRECAARALFWEREIYNGSSDGSAGAVGYLNDRLPVEALPKVVALRAGGGERSEGVRMHAPAAQSRAERTALPKHGKSAATARRP